MSIDDIDDIYYRLYFINKKMYVYCVGKNINKYKVLFNEINKKINDKNTLLKTNEKEIYLRTEFFEDNYSNVFLEFFSNTLFKILEFNKKKYENISLINNSSKIACKLRNENEINNGNRIFIIYND